MRPQASLSTLHLAVIGHGENLLRRVMAVSFRRAESAQGNVTRRPVPRMGQLPHLWESGGDQVPVWDQAVLHREQTGPRPVRGPDLRVDVLYVVPGGLR